MQTEELTIDDLNVLRRELKDLFHQLPVSADEILDLPDHIFDWIFE